MTIATLALLQLVTLGIGETRIKDVWRSHAPRWDVVELEARVPVSGFDLVSVVGIMHGPTDGPGFQVGVERRVGPIGIGARLHTRPCLNSWDGVTAWTDPKLMLALSARTPGRYGVSTVVGYDGALTFTIRLDAVLVNTKEEK